MKCEGCGLTISDGNVVTFLDGTCFCPDCALGTGALFCFNCGIYFGREDLKDRAVMACPSCGSSKAYIEDAKFD